MADQPEPETVDLSKDTKRDLSTRQRDQIRDLFESVYMTSKWRIIRANFLRGLAFGFGAFLGGTIVVAILIWLLSQTVDIFPPVRDFIERIIQSLQK